MKPDHWIPAVLGALRFHERDEHSLCRIAGQEWPALLDATDAEYLTIPLALRCHSLFPAEAGSRLRRTREKQILGHARVLSAYTEIADAFGQHNVDFLVLKGIAQWPWYVDSSEDRAQSDIDLFCPPHSMAAAASCLEKLGYCPAHSGSRLVAADASADHLPVLIRRTGWTWQGDFYDPERPPSVELHFRFWDSATEGFSAGDAESFFARRVIRKVGNIEVPTLSIADGLTYSGMHLVRHLLRGELRKRHVYELAHFLERSASEDEFWAEWDNTRYAQPRLIEALAFRLAVEWFRPQPHRVVQQTIDELPEPVSRWFDLFAQSPAAARPNKDELWLHFCLVGDSAARRKIAIRRLLPAVPRAVFNPHVAPQTPGFGLLLRRRAFALSFLARRAVHHLRALAPVVTSGFRLWKAGCWKAGATPL